MGRSVREISPIRGTFIYIRGYITASCLPLRVWGCTEGLVDQMNAGVEGQESLGLDSWVGRVPLVSEEPVLQGVVHCVTLNGWRLKCCGQSCGSKALPLGAKSRLQMQNLELAGP